MNRSSLLQHLSHFVALIMSVSISVFTVRQVPGDPEWMNDAEHLTLMILLGISMTAGLMAGYRIIAAFVFKTLVAFPVKWWNGLIFVLLTCLMVFLSSFSDQPTLIYSCSLVLALLVNQIIPENLGGRFRPVASWLVLAGAFIIFQLIMPSFSRTENPAHLFFYKTSPFPIAALFLVTLYYQVYCHKFERPWELVTHCLLGKILAPFAIALVFAMFIPLSMLDPSIVKTFDSRPHLAVLVLTVGLVQYEIMGPKFFVTSSGNLPQAQAKSLPLLGFGLVSIAGITCMTGTIKPVFFDFAVLLSLLVLLLMSEVILNDETATKWTTIFLRCLPASAAILLYFYLQNPETDVFRIPWVVMLVGISGLAWMPSSTLKFRLGGALATVCVICFQIMTL